MKKKKYRAVVFDLDGTLLDTLEDLADAVNYGLASLGMKERTLEEIRRFVGNGAKRLLQLSLEEGYSQEAYEQAFSAFQSYYNQHCNDKTGLYPGVERLLAFLKEEGFSMAIVSNKYQRGVQALQEQYFQEYVSVAIGEREGIRKKPAPDTVLEALRLLDIPKEQAVYIGDSEVDIATARNAGIDCVSVEWGFRTRKEQEEAGGEVFVSKPEEIIPLLYEED